MEATHRTAPWIVYAEGDGWSNNGSSGQGQIPDEDIPF